MRSPQGVQHGREFGAAAVELAIVLPLLILMVAGIVDFGRAYFTQITLTNAAREGARAAVVRADAVGRATAAANPIPTPTTVSAGSCALGDTTNPVVVTVSTSFDWIILRPTLNLFGGGGALPSQLTGSATMRCGG